MLSSKSLITLAALAMSAHAFVMTSPEKSAAVRLANAPFFVDVVEETKSPKQLTVPVIPEQPAIPAPKKKTPARKSPAKRGTGGKKHQDGIFTPVVKLGRLVLGEKILNKVRGKAISIHSDVIGGFVSTSDSSFGQTTLKQLFYIADKDGNGTIEKEELKDALLGLGFKLTEKQINGIFAKADKDGNNKIDMEEWLSAAPGTLRVNLIKLAKSNGEGLGFLS